MRVLVVTTHLVPSQMAVWRSASSKVDLHLAGTLHPGDTGGRPSGTAIPDFGTTHVFAPRDITGRGPVWWFYPGLHSLIRRLRPDIVHVHSEPWALLSLQAIRGSSPVVLHGADNMFSHGGGLESAIRVRVTKWSLGRALGYASWNQKGLDLAREHGLRPSAPTAVVPAGVAWASPPPSSSSEEVRRRLDLKGPLVVYAGRLVPLKGVAVLIRAMAALDLPDHTLVVVGDGPERLSLQAEAAQLGDRARFLGALSEQETLGVLAAADVAVTPSLSTATGVEQFGRSVVEAMAVRTAVVVSDSGALPDVVGDAGLVVPEGDVDALASTLRQLLMDGDLRARLAERGLVRYSAEHQPDVVARRLTELWAHALGGPR